MSIADQNVAAQEDRLHQSGAIRVFVDVISGKQFERPGPSELIDDARAGDSLCVTRLDRLARSLKELIKMVENLKAQGIYLFSLADRIDTTSAAGELVFHVFGQSLTSGDGSFPSARGTGLRRPENAAGGAGALHWTGEAASATQTLVEAGLTAAQAAKQLGIGRATSYRVTKEDPLCHRLTMLRVFSKPP